MLGQDKPRRLRAMGRGANYTKFLLSQAKDDRISQLEEEVRMLKKNLVYNISIFTCYSTCVVILEIMFDFFFIWFFNPSSTLDFLGYCMSKRRINASGKHRILAYA